MVELGHELRAFDITAVLGASFPNRYQDSTGVAIDMGHRNRVGSLTAL